MQNFTKEEPCGHRVSFADGNYKILPQVKQARLALKYEFLLLQENVLSFPSLMGLS